ncbi:MAG TPA: hypothetical protein VFI11_12370 [Anaerolineales bacterium]|nr:hypothetical protein [Anaerolineales bacterium]
MHCPNCKHTMLHGRVTLRSQYLSRTVFSPEGMADGFRQRWLKGTIFDRGLRPGEADVVSSYYGSKSPIARGAARCPNCGTIVIPP